LIARLPSLKADFETLLKKKYILVCCSAIWRTSGGKGPGATPENSEKDKKKRRLSPAAGVLNY
jgi:hypothetical protein